MLIFDNSFSQLYWYLNAAADENATDAADQWSLMMAYPLPSFAKTITDNGPVKLREGYTPDNNAHILTWTQLQCPDHWERCLCNRAVNER